MSICLVLVRGIQKYADIAGLLSSLLPISDVFKDLYRLVKRRSLARNKVTVRIDQGVLGKIRAKSELEPKKLAPQFSGK